MLSCVKMLETYQFNLASTDQHRAKRALPNFDWDDTRNLPNAQETREKVGEAWTGLMTMVNMVANKNSDMERWPRFFKHYFNDADDYNVDRVFRLIVGVYEPHEPNGSAAFLKYIVVTDHPRPGYDKDCDEKGRVAYTVVMPLPAPQKPQYVINLCPLAYKYPVSTATSCDKLGDKVSGMMDTWDGILLRELM
jgi:hypothetical protein